MVNHQQHRIYADHLRNGEEEGSKQESRQLVYHGDCEMKKAKPSPLRLIFLFSCIVLALLLFCSSAAFCPLIYSTGPEEEEGLYIGNTNTWSLQVESNGGPCSTAAAASICCDRTAFRADICFMLGGHVRTHSPTNTIILHSSTAASGGQLTTHPPREERIRPYPRKWETGIMDIVAELRLRVSSHPGEALPCDVRHDAPAVIFSTGGYTGNLYHDFNDGILPLYITTRHLNKRVVLVVLEYHNWWITKYRDVLSRLSDYPPIDFSGDTRAHCFPGAAVGLRIHGDLTVDAAQTESTTTPTIGDFRRLLDEAYRPRIRSLELEEEQEKEASPQPERSPEETQKPKLVIVSRDGSRRIENEEEVARLAEEVGFRVAVLRPERTTELAKIYRALNSSDAMLGVHGAAMTHFLFMRPGSAFIQIVPLGTRWAAETYYGEPAAKMGLWYSGYRILPEESSLYREYGKGDPVLLDPDNVTAKGWQVTKMVYLDGQSVRLDLARFGKRLAHAHRYLVSRKQRLCGESLCGISSNKCQTKQFVEGVI